MTTYADLRADVADELARDDLASKIPRFVRQATQRINRDVRTSEMERRARASGVGTRYLNSPPGFLEMRRLWNVLDVDTGGEEARQQLTAIRQVAPQHLRQKRAGGSLPIYFAVTRGDPPELEFDVPLAEDRQVEMIYVRRYDDLVADTDTNWVLSTHFDIYFQATLVYALHYLRNPAEAGQREAAFRVALAELEKAQRRRMYQQPMAAQPTQPVF